MLGAVITRWGQTSMALILKEKAQSLYICCKRYNQYNACIIDYTKHHNVRINTPVFYKKQTSSGIVYIQLYCMHLKVCMGMCV